MRRIRCLRAALVLVALWLPSWVPPGRRRAARIVENLYGAKLLDRAERLGGRRLRRDLQDHRRRQDLGDADDAHARLPLRGRLHVADARRRGRQGRARSSPPTTAARPGRSASRRPTNNLFSVMYASPQHVWAVGDWGAVVESKDGGATWTDRTAARRRRAHVAVLADESTATSPASSARIQKTTDGGKTFSQGRRPAPTRPSSAPRSAIAQDGWAVGIDGLVMRTKDGGSTWQPQRGTLEAQSLEQLGFLEAMKNPGLYDIRFVRRLRLHRRRHRHDPGRARTAARRGRSASCPPR